MGRENDSFASPRDATVADLRERIIEECANVAEEAIYAGERVRDAMAPESPINGLEHALHGIVVTTARGIAANIRLLKAMPDTRGEANPNSAQAEGTSHE